MNERPSPGSPGRTDDDLDSLIGDLEAESARRRAEPGFPLDGEARVDVELDRQAPPTDAAPPIGELLARMVDAVGRVVDEAATPAGRSGPRSRRKAGPSEELSELAVAVSGAVLALARRVENLEWQLRQLGDAKPGDTHRPK